jgi:hypothetical protein
MVKNEAHSECSGDGAPRRSCTISFETKVPSRRFKRGPLQKKEGPTRAAVLLKQFQPTFHRPHRVTAPIRGKKMAFSSASPFCLVLLLGSSTIKPSSLKCNCANLGWRARRAEMPLPAQAPALNFARCPAAPYWCPYHEPGLIRARHS